MTAAVAPGASHVEIVIVIGMGANAEAYAARLEEARRQRPARCPGCGGQHIVGHGGYERWAVYEDREVRVWIRRWKCTGCGKTISLLPSFLHRHRHYALAVIEAVMRGRLERGRPWSGLAPSQRSLRRWVAAFVAHEETQAVVPGFDGRGGHPVLLPASARDVLLAAPSAMTLREILRDLHAVRVPVSDTSAATDTARDWRQSSPAGRP